MRICVHRVSKPSKLSHSANSLAPILSMPNSTLGRDTKCSEVSLGFPQFLKAYKTTPFAYSQHNILISNIDKI
jgi:hypothetical protein